MSTNKTPSPSVPISYVILLFDIAEDAEHIRQHIRHVAAIHQRFSEMKLLPAHNAPAMLELPVLPNSRN